MSNLVFVRLRPLKSCDTGKACVRTTRDSVITSKDPKCEQFTFDRCYSHQSSQEDIFNGVEHIVDAVIHGGYNGTIMAYGQTGSGKTHTMFGDASDAQEQGIVPRVARKILQTTNPSSTSPTSSIDSTVINVSISVVEIYQEKCRDLLNPSQDNLQVYQDPATQGVKIPGMTALPVTTPADCMDIINRGMSARAVASTNMNDASSRSHCLVIVTVERIWHAKEEGRQGDSKKTATKKIMTSKLCLVDLAGSERQSKTGAQGVTLQEGQSINKSLLVLSSVVHALNAQQQASLVNSSSKESTSSSSSSSMTHVVSGGRIPYRNSKLTRLLQDSLGGTAKACILVCCSPAPSDYTETISSLRFGMRARAVENKVQINAIRHVVTPEEHSFNHLDDNLSIASFTQRERAMHTMEEVSSNSSEDSAMSVVNVENNDVMKQGGGGASQCHRRVKTNKTKRGYGLTLAVLTIIQILGLIALNSVDAYFEKYCA